MCLYIWLIYINYISHSCVCVLNKIHPVKTSCKYIYIYTGTLFGFDSFCLLLVSCSYYELEDVNHETVNRYLSNLVERSLRDLGCSYCIEIHEVCFLFFLNLLLNWKGISLYTSRLHWLFQDDRSIEPLTHGRIASYYYLKHQTVRMFKERLRPELPIHELLSILTVRISPSVHRHRFLRSCATNALHLCRDAPKPFFLQNESSTSTFSISRLLLLLLVVCGKLSQSKSIHLSFTPVHLCFVLCLCDS